jgi:5-(carboxyamino)imidazole ribonucleotide mutase
VGKPKEDEIVKQTKVAVVMGSRSDWETMKAACEMLDHFEVEHQVEVVSAHRTPKKLMDFASSAAERGIKVIIAGAGGAAHLPGMLAACSSLPVFGVPVESKSLKGMDSLLSIAQMPKGVAVGTLAIGPAGAANAGLLATQVLALNDADLAKRVDAFRELQTKQVLAHPDPRVPNV